MNRHGRRMKYGSTKKQVVDQSLVMPVLAIIYTILNRMNRREITNLTQPSEYCLAIHCPPSDVGDSGAGSSPTPPVGSSKSHLLLEGNLPTAPVPEINPRLIARIPEKDEDLQNAVVYQNSKLFKSEGQWVVELLSERTK